MCMQPDEYVDGVEYRHGLSKESDWDEEEGRRKLRPVYEGKQNRVEKTRNRPYDVHEKQICVLERNV